MPKLLTIIVLAGIAYGAWYLFTEYYQQKITHVNPRNENVLEGTLIEDNDTGEEQPAEDGTKGAAAVPAPEKRVTAEKSTEANDTVLETNASVEKEKDATSRETITLLPQGEMWFELIDLKSGKKSEFRREEKLDIDVRENPWLFATKNTKFAFIDNSMIIEYGGEGMLYFKLDKNGIHELSKEEYLEETREQ